MIEVNIPQKIVEKELKKAKTGNVLKETFGTLKFKKSTSQLIKETDSELK